MAAHEPETIMIGTSDFFHAMHRDFADIQKSVARIEGSVGTLTAALSSVQAATADIKVLQQQVSDLREGGKAARSTAQWAVGFGITTMLGMAALAIRLLGK